MSTKNEIKTIWQVAPEVLFSRIDDEMILMSISEGYYFTLDPVGTRIWELLSRESSTLINLTDQLMEEYEVDKETCMKDLQEFIEDMASKKLIIPAEQENPPEK